MVANSIYGALGGHRLYCCWHAVTAFCVQYGTVPGLTCSIGAAQNNDRHARTYLRLYGCLRAHRLGALLLAEISSSGGWGARWNNVVAPACLHVVVCHVCLPICWYFVQFIVAAAGTDAIFKFSNAHPAAIMAPPVAYPSPL